MRIAVHGLDITIDATTIVRGVDLEVADGERIALLGPSGSGKSTLLRAIAGLRRPTAGRIELGGKDADGQPTHLRGVGLVFQDGALFPHRDVAGNVGYGLEVAGLAATERAARVAEVLALVGLEGTGGRRVETLSGGEAQRVALARALAPRPRALLLDEPLGALDGPLRERLQDDLRTLFGLLAMTAIHVTHDVGEAFALGHRVALMRAGALVQVGTPDELWHRPADEWAARFLGMRNVEARGALARVVRPEAIRIIPGDDALVTEVARRGATAIVTLGLAGGGQLEAVVPSLSLPAPGERVGIEIDPTGVIEVPVSRAGWDGTT